MAVQLLFDFIDSIAKGLEVVGVAPIDLNGNRFAHTVSQQSYDDLFFAFLAVAIIAPGGQGIVIALQIAAGDIIEEELILGSGEAGLPQKPFDEGMVAPVIATDDNTADLLDTFLGFCPIVEDRPMAYLNPT